MLIYFGRGLTENCRFQILLAFGARRDASADEEIWRFHWEWSFGRSSSDDEDEYDLKQNPFHQL